MYTYTGVVEGGRDGVVGLRYLVDGQKRALEVREHVCELGLGR
jgi:hypothetical protein